MKHYFSFGLEMLVISPDAFWAFSNMLFRIGGIGAPIPVAFSKMLPNSETMYQERINCTPF